MELATITTPTGFRGILRTLLPAKSRGRFPAQVPLLTTPVKMPKSHYIWNRLKPLLPFQIQTPPRTRGLTVSDKNSGLLMSGFTYARPSRSVVPIREEGLPFGECDVCPGDGASFVLTSSESRRLGFDCRSYAEALE